MGDGVETLFWWDPWLDRDILKDGCRLFYLSDNKLATMADMFSLGWGGGR